MLVKITFYLDQKLYLRKIKIEVLRIQIVTFAFNLFQSLLPAEGVKSTSLSRKTIDFKVILMRIAHPLPGRDQRDSQMG